MKVGILKQSYYLYFNSKGRQICNVATYYGKVFAIQLPKKAAGKVISTTGIKYITLQIQKKSLVNVTSSGINNILEDILTVKIRKNCINLQEGLCCSCKATDFIETARTLSEIECEICGDIYIDGTLIKNTLDIEAPIDIEDYLYPPSASASNT